MPADWHSTCFIQIFGDSLCSAEIKVRAEEGSGRRLEIGGRNMASESENEEKTIESSSLVLEAATKTDSAIRSTAEKYINRTRAREVETTIRENPLAATALAALAGFVVGGGMASRPGSLILALLAREAAQEAATNFVGEMVRGRRS
jgi:ElaB/YqjD/DUF883 family membrane-anchored ribosome-binding protein